MKYSYSALVFAPLAFAKVITIQVGESGLVFSPASTTAAIGDEIFFEFYPGGHSVAQSAFSSPCQPLDGGFYSGFFTQTTAQTVGKLSPSFSSERHLIMM